MGEREMVRNKNENKKIILILFSLIATLFSACSDPYALQANWMIALPENYTEVKCCEIAVGFNTTRVIKCLCEDSTVKDQYKFAPINKAAEKAFSYIKSSLWQCNTREIKAKGTSLKDIEVIDEINEKWESLDAYLVAKSSSDYCLLLFDSSNNVLYICEST